jgi:hypothetical protein
MIAAAKLPATCRGPAASESLPRHSAGSLEVSESSQPERRRRAAPGEPTRPQRLGRARGSGTLRLARRWRRKSKTRHTEIRSGGSSAAGADSARTRRARGPGSGALAGAGPGSGWPMEIRTVTRSDEPSLAQHDPASDAIPTGQDPKRIWPAGPGPPGPARPSPWQSSGEGVAEGDDIVGGHREHFPEDQTAAPVEEWPSARASGPGSRSSGEGVAEGDVGAVPVPAPGKPRVSDRLGRQRRRL